MIREYIAYEGAEFTIEWYYDPKGISPAFEYYKSLKIEERIKLLRLLKRMGDAGEIKDKTKFNFEGNQVYAFKPKPQRFLCFFFTGKKIIMTNAFCKKQDKLPQNEKEKALKYKTDYEKELITVITMSKKSISTFEREMKNAKFKKSFEKSYKELLLSELLIAIMKDDEKSVRMLAKEVGISPTVIQKIRSGKQDDIKVSNFVNIVHACGYKIILEKNDERFEIQDKKIKDKHSLNFVWA